MPDLFLPMLLLSTFFAAIIQGVTGFAFAMIFLACMQYFLPYTELLSISAVLALFMLTMNVYIYRHHIVWKWLPLPILINFVFTIASIKLLQETMHFPYWHKLLGIIFIFLALYMYFFQSKINIQPSLRNAFLFCGAGGILGGLFGVGGPPVVLYFLAVADNKEKYLSTTQMFFWFNMLYDFLGRAINGMVTAATFHYASFCLITVAIGLWIGRHILCYIDSYALKKMVYFLIFLDGWYMLLLS